jgi:hypothetical protein
MRGAICQAFASQVGSGIRLRIGLIVGGLRCAEIGSRSLRVSAQCTMLCGIPTFPSPRLGQSKRFLWGIPGVS